MATGKSYLTFILDQLSEVDGISHRQMMGEYIIYKNGRIIAYLCDNRMLIKPTKHAILTLPNAPLVAPYEGARAMILVENTEDREFLKDLFDIVYPDLPAPKKK